ncbi:ATPase family AAA domain-containing protein 2 isoform X2 [Bicyclus anynana]|uniref:ATPase family AAA domain-containing protein 2 isoform X2 n=1 Tax=Bicyclus anynana TaxID=110368 RepID=A0ABM3LW17_BICAN|nr:ATPase family AAA domain-containing protein 2 isoform X2 [Bicyclus anynana]
MVKTRRSNGENGEVDEGNYSINEVGSVSDEKASNWSQRELRSSQYKVTRKIQRWPAKYNRSRVRAIKMPRIMFPESDTEPEKYSRRSRQVRVFFADDNDSTNRSLKIRRNRGPRKNYMEDSEDKPIQQNVRRSCRKRKLLHHNFNESWITNELKVKGYPDLYCFPGTSSSDEFSSGDEARDTKKLTRSHVPTNTDEDTQLSRLRRTSARFTNKKDASESDSDDDKNLTVIEKKPVEAKTEKENNEKMDTEEAQETMSKDKLEKESKTDEKNVVQDSESNPRPVRSTRGRGRKKVNLQQDTASSSSSSESGSVLGLRPRRSKRTRAAQPARFVQLAPRETRGRPRVSGKTFTLRKKPYSLRERKPKLRRKTIRSQSPSSSSSSSSTTDSDTEEDLNVSMKNKTKGRQKSKSMNEDKKDRALRDIQPIEVDGSVRFSSVGGLEDHIKCLREMVLFPLMYPDLFDKFKTRPAKGVLFHGPPGTGKTLLARALANECSLVGGRKVAFFMRKGADCLKKWVGESERHLKLLFQQANKMKPSIIFFDEIDALAPVRSVRQEQVHTSVVGTLLAEMDGVCDRGEVIVIGATNRLDAVDPALRRAGRFDRELHFPPPHASARRDILDIYTRHWQPRLTDDTLTHIADITNGYGGSDLKALCSEAVLKALRRVYPQVYESECALVIVPKNVEVTVGDLESAMSGLVAAGARSSPAAARRLPHYSVPLLQSQLRSITNMIKEPSLTQRHGRYTDTPASANVLLIVGECAETHLAPALLAQLERCAVRELSVAALHSALAFTQEQALISLFSECRRADRGCILFIRDIMDVWRSLSGGAGAALLLQLWRTRAAGDNTLLVATAPAHASLPPQVNCCILFIRDIMDVWRSLSGGAGAALLLQLWRTRAAGDNTLLVATAPAHASLPPQLQELFPAYKECVYRVREPTSAEVINFLKPIISEAPLEAPIVQSTQPPPPLPRAPPPPPPRESEVEIARRKRKEDYKLRELRIFLRDICRKLASNRRFYKFTKPVDLEEVTDYLDIVKQPMDLETMMTKVDLHKYNCAKEFLDDVDLICANALEYNPDRTSSDKQIRHEACALRDHAHALIDVEMDSDFELDCQEIARRRVEEGAADNDLPDFIYTASNLPQVSLTTEQNDSKTVQTPQNGEKSETHSAKRKRRRINAWSKGLVVKRQKTTPKNFKDSNMPITDEESKENKPITSTPLHNGSCSSSGSDDDAPLRRPANDESLLNLTPHPQINHVLESPAKSTERTPTKQSPKKRNSGHETSTGDTEKVLINKTELDNILYKNAKALRNIGLEALLDLYADLAACVRAYVSTHDRTKLPHELHAVITRYLHANK